MSCRLPYLVAISVAAVSFSAAPAMATDDPAPPVGAPPAAAPVPQAPAAPLAGGAPACVDHSLPSARLSTPSAGASRTKTLRGTATDRGCAAGGSGKVARVTVSLALERHGRCQFLSRSHRLGRAASCRKPHFLSANGTSRWSFRLPKHLTKGRYRVTVRAVDSVGNVAQASTRALRIG
jgi:hypothetical protein